MTWDIATDEARTRRSPLFHNAKFSELAGWHVVAGFCHAFSIEIVSERSGLSEKTVKRLFTGLRDRLFARPFNRWHFLERSGIHALDFAANIRSTAKFHVVLAACASNKSCHRNYRLGNRASRACRACPIRQSALAEGTEFLAGQVQLTHEFYVSLGWRSDQDLLDGMRFLKRVTHMRVARTVLQHSKTDPSGFCRGKDDGFLSAATLFHTMIASLEAAPLGGPAKPDDATTGKLSQTVPDEVLAWLFFNSP